MKPQHGTNPRDRSDRRARHQALERAEKQAERRACQIERIVGGHWCRAHGRWADDGHVRP